MDGTPSVITEIRYWICYDACMFCFPRENWRIHLSYTLACAGFIFRSVIPRSRWAVEESSNSQFNASLATYAQGKRCYTTPCKWGQWVGLDLSVTLSLLATCYPWWHQWVFKIYIVFLKCSDNNRSSAALSSFPRGVHHTHGLPQHGRTNFGGKNVEIWRYMTEQRADASAVITGSSTHDEQIECLWCDVYRCVGVLFMIQSVNWKKKICWMFLMMYCLHYVFIPQINSVLDVFFGIILSNNNIMLSQI